MDLNAGERYEALYTPRATCAGDVWMAFQIRHRPTGPRGLLALRCSDNATLPTAAEAPPPAAFAHPGDSRSLSDSHIYQQLLNSTM